MRDARATIQPQGSGRGMSFPPITIVLDDNEPGERMNATLNAPASPYSACNIDAAITHLERVLSAEGANSLFGQTYWKKRVQQVKATRGLHRNQQIRIERLMTMLSDSAR
jgi:hypothetical protein